MGFKHILVAVDFSPDSEAALNWALVYAVQTKAQLSILHVVHDPADEPGFYRRGEDVKIQPMATTAKEMMDEFIAGFNDQKLESASTILVEGLPPERIIEVAGKIGADHIVMGCRGRTGLKNNILGSNAKSVVQLSPLPVTVVKTDLEKV